MSFLSVIKTIGHDAEIGVQAAHVVAPIISLTPIGPVFNTILNLVTVAENAVPESGKGPVRKEAVMAAVNALHPNLDQQQLSAAVDSTIAALNAVNKAQSAKS